MGKRRFGRVRRLPSGQYQARYAGPDGIDRPAPQTFTSKGDAEIWLTMKEAEIRRGDWTDPEAGKVRFGDYAANWISDHVFKPRTEGLYRSQLKNHLAPTFGKKDLRDIHEADIRRWRKERLDAGPHAARPFGPVTVAKTYRLLHAIMNTAVEDGLIRHNPCRIKGAGQEYSPERPVVPVGTLVRLLDDVPPRYRALLLLATFANLRFGELAGLRRDQLDLDKCLVRVAVSTAEMDDGRLIDAGPKSRAGTRTVAFPREIVSELRWHLECFAQSEKDGGLVFVGPLGGRLRRSNFRRFWYKARDAVGLPELHFHDLRHTGNTMAAAQGASLRELMERMGHSSTRAALIYLHATQERDQAIAAGMGKLLSDARKTGRRPNRSGTQRARGRRSAS
ncbi:MAG: tyrosine-type recombinase/integrase [Streptosporangiaceae bacterium]